jgi:predicted HD phosphohydrolase
VFAPAVLAPIRLHVDAKRCLCALDTGYWDTLSPGSSTPPLAHYLQKMVQVNLSSARPA